jgi:hypothetical protein
MGIPLSQVEPVISGIKPMEGNRERTADHALFRRSITPGADVLTLNDPPSSPAFSLMGGLMESSRSQRWTGQGLARAAAGQLAVVQTSRLVPINRQH